MGYTGSSALVVDKKRLKPRSFQVTTLLIEVVFTYQTTTFKKVLRIFSHHFPNTSKGLGLWAILPIVDVGARSTPSRVSFSSVRLNRT